MFVRELSGMVTVVANKKLADTKSQAERHKITPSSNFCRFSAGWGNCPY